MKIFKDVFSGDELFSDPYPIKLVDGVMWEVQGKVIKFFIMLEFVLYCMY